METLAETTDFICNYSPEDLVILEELLTKNNELLENLLVKIDILQGHFSNSNSLFYILVFSLAGVGMFYLFYRFLKVFI